MSLVFRSTPLPWPVAVSLNSHDVGTAGDVHFDLATEVVDPQTEIDYWVTEVKSINIRLLESQCLVEMVVDRVWVEHAADSKRSNPGLVKDNLRYTESVEVDIASNMIG